MTFYYDNSEYESAEEIDLYREHTNKKLKRNRQRYLKKHKQEVLFYKRQISRYKPSIWAEVVWKEGKQDYICRVKRAHNSKWPKYMKKQTRRIVRRLPLEEIPLKGTSYRRYYDYWWIWI